MVFPNAGFSFAFYGVFKHAWEHSQKLVGEGFCQPFFAFTEKYLNLKIFLGYEMFGQNVC